MTEPSLPPIAAPAVDAETTPLAQTIDANGIRAEQKAAPEIITVRALFLSDTHLGMRQSRAELLLDFLNHYRARQIYLVGDILDGWRLKSPQPQWPRAHDAVVTALLARVREGARVLYLPGNHDAFLRRALGTTIAGVAVVDQAIHEAADGTRYLVLHGDQFDVVALHAHWLALAGDAAYRAALSATRSFRRSRRQGTLPGWSFSAWAKRKVKEAVNLIGHFERLVAEEARRVGAQGVICGHIHHAAMHEDFGIRYINTGDWVESCTAVVEHTDGRFEIVRWAERQRGEAQAPAKLPAMHRAGRAVRRRLIWARSIRRRVAASEQEG